MTELDPQNTETGKSTILFGGSGFLGPYILENYPDIISVGRTVPLTRNRHIPVKSLENLDALNDLEFDKVIYIIGNTDHYNLEKENLSSDEPTAFDYHLIPLIQTMEQLKHYPIKKFIHFSTVLIYDENKITLPVSEHSPIDPYKNRYTMSKYMGEEACKFYSNWIPIINVRLSNIYGPTPLKRFDLIHGLIHQLLDNGKGKVWTTKPSRDFIYIDDAAHAIVKLLETDYTGTLNLGSGTMTTVKHVVEVLEEISGCPITDLDQPVSGPMKFRCDMTTLNRLIDWKPRYSTEEGARRTFDLMKSWKEKSYEVGN